MYLLQLVMVTVFYQYICIKIHVETLRLPFNHSMKLQKTLKGHFFLKLKIDVGPLRNANVWNFKFQLNACKNGPPFRSVCVSPSCDLEKTHVIIEPREIDFQHTFNDYEQNFIVDELRLRISSDV